MKIKLIKRLHQDYFNLFKYRKLVVLLVTIQFQINLKASAITDSLEHILESNLSIGSRIEVKLQLATEYLISDNKLMLKWLDDIESELKLNPNTRQIVKYNVLKSKYHQNKVETEQGLKLLENALKYVDEIEDSIYYKAQINYVYGKLYDDMSKPYKSIEHHLTSLRYAEMLDDKEIIASASAGLGRVYLYLREYQKAKDYYLKSIKIKEQNNVSDYNLATYYTNISNVYDAMNQLDSSVYFIDKSIAQHAKFNKFRSLITPYNNKAYTLLLLNKLDEAEIAVLKSISISDSLDLKVETMYAYSTYAEILFAQNKNKKAEDYMLKSIALSESYQDYYLEEYNLDLMYNIALEKNDFEKAIHYLELKSIVKDSMYNINTRTSIEQISQQYETEKKNQEIKLLNKEKVIQDGELNRSNLLRVTFLITSILLLVVGLLLWLRYKNKRKTEKLIQEALERSYEKKLTDAELQALRAQMNPHFLFNCLNSINSFIIKNQQEQASEYLGKFSKLIRKVLNNSKSAKVTLGAELEALQLYIEMEALRFSDKFKYDINLDSNVEKDYIEVPPLIIQPYVENSIWHGLMHKKNGEGKLTIEVKQDREKLICTIEDNGIGRDEAKKIKSKSAIKRKSYGMSITKDRLNYVNEKYKVDTNVEVLDLFDSNGIGNGTKVIIKIGID